jgi:RNA polymerase sigma-70 factor (ECF subfamily)
MSLDHSIDRSRCEILYRRAMWLTRDPDEAHDLVQDTIERYLRKGRHKVSSDRVMRWLLLVMRRLFVDRVRSPVSRWTALGEIEVAVQTDEDSADVAPLWTMFEPEDVADALKRLPTDLRRAYEMYALEKMSYQRIAGEMKTSIGTVGTRIYRARQRLRDALLDTGAVTSPLAGNDAPRPQLTAARAL